MISNLAALLSGVLFGLGLVIAGMTNPAKVIAFLDVFGRWDPSLALVMVGAIGVHFTLARLILRRRRSLLGGGFHALHPGGADARLVVGAAAFGAGWGLGGICPGPGVVGVATGSAYALVFAACMALGVLVERRLLRRREDGSVPSGDCGDRVG